MSDPQHQPPDRSLGAKPRISSPDDVSLALAWLGYLEAERVRIEAACAEAIRPVKERFEQQMAVTVAGRPIPFGDYAVRLEEAVRKFAETHRREVFTTADCKTAKYTHGEVSARKMPARIDFAEGQTAQTVITRVMDRCGWKAKLATWLKRFPLLRLVCDVELKLASKRRLLEQYQAGDLTAEDLGDVGLAVAGGDEAIVVKPYQYTVRAEIGRAAS